MYQDALKFWVDSQREEDCRRRGGQYVHLYKSSVCVKPGTVIQ